MEGCPLMDVMRRLDPAEKMKRLLIILHALWRARSTGGGGLLIASESRCCCQKFAVRTGFVDSSGQKAVNGYGVSSLCRV